MTSSTHRDGAARWHLLERAGFEVEYTIVDSASLEVRPFADKLLMGAACLQGSGAGEELKGGAGTVQVPADVERDQITWSNELVNHVIEMKLGEPTTPESIKSGKPVSWFAAEVQKANELLLPLGSCLLPTGMHPWMKPAFETQLWAHEGAEIYQAFHRLFNCHRHGWANVQSTHLNLSFSGDAEFAKLHSAVRLILPLIPGLAASSPFVEGVATGLLDNRLDFYRRNSSTIHSLAGRVIPEPVYNEEDYHTQILGPIHVDLSSFDTQGVLRKEFSNARGAIARFERGSMEIRVLDSQECPTADFFCSAAVIAGVQQLMDFCDSSHCTWSIDDLEPIFLSTIRSGDEAVIENGEYLKALQYSRQAPVYVRDLWLHLAAGLAHDSSLAPAVAVYADGGCLARRILTVTRGSSLRETYGELARCLAANELFGG